MSDFRALAHLLEQIGEERFKALIKSDNTSKVREFCDGLVKDALPTEMTIDGVTYDILGFLREKEKYIKGTEMISRVKEMSANLGEEEGKRLLKHQSKIPAAVRGKVIFVFTDWRNPDESDDVYYVYWFESSQSWVETCTWLGDNWGRRCRVLRRK